MEPKKKLTMAYTMNKMRPGMKDDEREIALREAVYGCLGRLVEIESKESSRKNLRFIH